MALLTFQQMQADLALAGMGQLLAADFGALLNRAMAEELDAYEWSFLLANTVLATAAPYSVGTIAVAQGSATVTGTGTAWTSAFANFEIRFGPSGMLLPIASVNSATQLTLATPWMGAAVAGSNYSLVRRFYPIAGAKEITAVKQVVYLDKVSREALNLSDPQRLSVGGAPALTWAIAPRLAGVLQIELWPVPSSVLPYPVEYRVDYAPMVNPTDLPVVPAAVLEAKAMMYAAQALFASSGDPRWGALADRWQADFVREREAARAADKKRALTLSPPASRTSVFGMDYLPSHDPY